MKKFFVFLTIMIVCFSSLCACGQNPAVVSKKQWQFALYDGLENSTIVITSTVYDKDFNEVDFDDNVKKEIAYQEQFKSHVFEYKDGKNVSYSYYFAIENNDQYKYFYEGDNYYKKKLLESTNDDTGYIDIMTCFCWKYDYFVFNSATEQYERGEFVYKDNTYQKIAYKFENGKLINCVVTFNYKEDYFCRIAYNIIDYGKTNFSIPSGWTLIED